MAARPAATGELVQTEKRPIATLLEDAISVLEPLRAMPALIRARGLAEAPAGVGSSAGPPAG